MAQLCRSCSWSEWQRVRLGCGNPSAAVSGRKVYVPNVAQCPAYEREPGSDDYIGEEAEHVTRAA